MAADHKPGLQARCAGTASSLPLLGVSEPSQTAPAYLALQRESQLSKPGL